MEIWESKKGNGSKGGRPKKTETITETITESKPNIKANRNHNRIEDNRIKDNKEEKEKHFNIFWSFYPNKVAKEKCKDKFLKLEQTDINQILDTIQNWAKYKPFDSYSHPNPETYINQKRWQDVIPTIKKQYIDLTGQG